MRERYEQLKNIEEARRCLIAWKTALKDKETGRQSLKELKEDFLEEPEILLSLLKAEDAKTRKNAALVLGAVGTGECKEALLAAYQAEEQYFVKSAYLNGLKGYDCAEDTEFLRERRRELLGMERSPETEKHIREELEALNSLLSPYEAAKRRRFVGLSRPADVILTTWKDYRQVTADEITRGTVTLLGSGVRVKEGDLEELLSVRTFRELLFCLDVEEVSPENAGELLASSNLRELLKSSFSGGAPWKFRIECRGRMNLEERSAFTKRLADELMQKTGGTLLNDVSDYEAELRLVEKKSGAFLPLLKLPGLPDHRFSYRRRSTAASMQPALAALLVKLAEDWMEEGARVLDPFCGVGTLLLERNYRKHADTLYGVDSFGPAIEGARENAAVAGVPAHFVNKDVRSFRHEYLFDEIITDMPSQGGKRTSRDVEFLYRVLFEQAGTLLKSGGMIFVYSHDRGFAKRQLRECGGMKLEKEWRISEKEDAWLLAVRRL